MPTGSLESGDSPSERAAVNLRDGSNDIFAEHSTLIAADTQPRPQIARFSAWFASPRASGRTC